MAGRVIGECSYVFVSFIYMLNIYFLTCSFFLFYHKPVLNLSPYMHVCTIYNIYKHFVGLLGRGISPLQGFCLHRITQTENGLPYLREFDSNH